MKKILFGITSLNLGGAERVLVDLVNELQVEYDITIFTIYSKGEMEKQLNPKIKLQSLINSRYDELNKFQKILISLKLLILKKSIYNKQVKNDYDIEIAFLEGPITRLFAVENENTRKIAWIHNDITKVFGTGIKAVIKKKSDKKVYEKYEKLIFVSRDNKEKFEEIYNLDNEKDVIYNYINIDNIKEKANENIDIQFNKNVLNIVTVARLVEQKAIDRLVKIHAKLINEGLNHKIYVIGDGPEKGKIKELIKDNNVKNSFILLGKKENPYPYIKQADCFALLSYFEGYGMVLIEAQILDKFIIITDTAARESLQNYHNRMIVGNNEEDIYIGLSKIIKNKEEYIKTNYNTNKYDNSEILNQVKNLINE